MIPWQEVFLVAFVSQLAALPGEKVQFIIAGLATRYRPAVVVGAAGTAFALWTMLEIWLGTAIKTLLPAMYLTALTGILFAAFAVWLYVSAPERGTRAVDTDGGYLDGTSVDLSVFGRDVPQYLGGFLPIFVLMAVGEFGDKTQLVTIGLAATYGARPAIWAGEMAAIIPVSVANAVFFHRHSHRFDRRFAHLAGASLFALFALDSAIELVLGFSLWGMAVEAITTTLLLVSR